MYTWGAILWAMVQGQLIIYEQEDVTDGLMQKTVIPLNPQIENGEQLEFYLSELLEFYMMALPISTYLMYNLKALLIGNCHHVNFMYNLKSKDLGLNHYTKNHNYVEDIVEVDG